MKEVITDGCKIFLQRKKKQKKQKWITEATLEIAKRGREAKFIGDKEAVRIFNREFQKSARKDKELYYGKMCMNLESDIAKGRIRSAFIQVRNIRGKFKPHVAMFKDKYGNILNEPEDIRRRWKEYTDNLYQNNDDGESICLPETYEHEPMIMKEEVEAALKVISRNKAPGTDEIPIEVFQHSEEALDQLTDLCKKIWES